MAAELIEMFAGHEQDDALYIARIPEEPISMIKAMADWHGVKPLPHGIPV